MNVTCNTCKIAMECTAKRQSTGSITTMSDYRCSGCNCEITIGRKGMRQSDDISIDREEG